MDADHWKVCGTIENLILDLVCDTSLTNGETMT